MISITESILIARAPADVFAFACDYRNDTRWRTGVVEMVLRPDGPPGHGTKTREVMHFMGRRMETDSEVVLCRPDEEIAFRVIQGPIPASGYRRVASDSGGARLTYHIEAEPTGAFKVFSPLMRWTFRRQLLKDLQRVKHEIENKNQKAA